MSRKLTTVIVMVFMLPSTALAVMPCAMVSGVFLHQLDYSGGSEGCGGMPTPGNPLVLEIVATVNVPPRGISAAVFPEFIYPVPEEGQGEIIVTWTADHVEGDLDTGFTLAWDEPVPVGENLDTYLNEGGTQCFHLGYLEVITYDEDWPPVNSTIQMGINSDDEPSVGDWIHLTSDWGAQIDAWSGFFQFNEHNGAECFPGVIIEPNFGRWERISYLEPVARSHVGPNFDFSFDVDTWRCRGSLWLSDHAGSVYANNVLVGSFTGVEHATYSFPVSVLGLENGDEIVMKVQIYSHYGDGTMSEQVTLIYDSTPVEKIDISAVKAMYR